MTIKKRAPKRLDAESIKSIIEQKINGSTDKNPYKGVVPERILWNTLCFDENLKRQVITINTVDENDEPDGNTRTIATSDLHHVKHTKEVSEKVRKIKNNLRRSNKNKK